MRISDWSSDVCSSDLLPCSCFPVDVTPWRPLPGGRRGPYRSDIKRPANACQSRMAGVIALTSPFLQPQIAVECRGWLAIGWQLIGYVGATAGRGTAHPEGRARYSKRCQPFNCL